MFDTRRPAGCARYARRRGKGKKTREETFKSINRRVEAFAASKGASLGEARSGRIDTVKLLAYLNLETMPSMMVAIETEIPSTDILESP